MKSIGTAGDEYAAALQAIIDAETAQRRYWLALKKAKKGGRIINLPNDIDWHIADARGQLDALLQVRRG